MRELVNTTLDFKIDGIEILNRYCCLKCKQEVTVNRFKMPIGPKKGELQTSTIGCDCELIDKIKLNQQDAKKAKIQRLFADNSVISVALKNAEFNNFDQGKYKNEFATAVCYVENFDIQKPRNLILQGEVGTGKSHLSISIARELRDRGYSTIFISTSNLLDKIKSTFNDRKGNTEEQITNTLVSADLVVFDDIGAGDGGEFALGKLFKIIDLRAGKHNVFTTNLTKDYFFSSIDLERIFSRMTINATIVVMNGDDYRMKNYIMRD